MIARLLHAIGFEEESQIELIGRQHFEIVCAIVVGGTVHVAAVVEDEHEVFTGSDVLRSLEHHVFKQDARNLCDPCVRHVNRRCRLLKWQLRRGMIFNCNHTQAVL